MVRQAISVSLIGSALTCCVFGWGGCAETGVVDSATPAAMASAPDGSTEAARPPSHTVGDAGATRVDATGTPNTPGGSTGRPGNGSGMPGGGETGGTGQDPNTGAPNGSGSGDTGGEEPGPGTDTSEPQSDAGTGEPNDPGNPEPTDSGTPEPEPDSGGPGGGPGMPNASCSPTICEGRTTGDASSCGTARIIGRKQATVGIAYDGDTTTGTDAPSLGLDACPDYGQENYFQIYLHAGDQLALQVTNVAGTHDPLIKLYPGSDCDWPAANNVLCTDKGFAGQDEVLAADILGESWFYVVVDSYLHPGSYRLAAKLTPNESVCSCP